MKKYWLPWLILSPSLLFLALFTYFPLLRSVYDSLFDTRMASDNPPFVGAANFTRLLEDSVFWQSLLNNLLYILLTVIPGVTLALLLAVALWENHRVNRWLRTAFFLPDDYPDGQRGCAVAVYLYARPRHARSLPGHPFWADE